MTLFHCEYFCFDRFMTADTTRTVHFGTPKDFEMEAFTRVLKGFISMGMATFPKKAPVSLLLEKKLLVLLIFIYMHAWSVVPFIKFNFIDLTKIWHSTCSR